MFYLIVFSCYIDIFMNIVVEEYKLKLGWRGGNKFLEIEILYMVINVFNF